VYGFKKYDTKYLSFGFTYINVDGKERPQCLLCIKILAADSMKPNKLKWYLQTVHAGCVGKAPNLSTEYATSLINKHFQVNDCYIKIIACIIQSCLQN